MEFNHTSVLLTETIENLKTEKEYNEAMEHLTIMHLERVLKIANLDADQRRTIEQQLLDFKVKCLQHEEKERKKLEDEYSIYPGEHVMI